MQTGCAGIWFNILKICDCRPDIVLIISLIFVIADHYIVSYALIRICKACFVLGSVINVACPAIRLDTYGDIGLFHFQLAADISDFVVICGMAINYGVFRSHGGNTCVLPSLIHIIIGVFEAY